MSDLSPTIREQPRAWCSQAFVGGAHHGKRHGARSQRLKRARQIPPAARAGAPILSSKKTERA